MTQLKLLVLLLLCAPVALWAQDTSSQQLPGHYLSMVARRVGALQTKLDGKSQSVLQHFQRGEEKLYRRLLKKDPARAAQLLASSKEQYRDLEQKLQTPQELSQYLPFLDTLNTSLQFLKDNPQWLAKSKEAGKELSGTLDKVQGLKGELAKTESIRQFLRQRRGQLKEQLEGLPFAGELKKLNKQAYYYSSQVQEYKEVLKDPKKIERKALALLSKTELYQKFMREHSQLAALFRLPGGGGAADPSVALQGLQTRAQVSGLIQQRIAAGGSRI